MICRCSISWNGPSRSHHERQKADSMQKPDKHGSNQMADYFVLRLIAPEGGSALGSVSGAADFVEAAVAGKVQYKEYVKSCDVEAHDGRGEALFTSNRWQAKRFESFVAAMEYWKKQSTRRPL